MKKLISLLLAVIMVVGMFSVGAMALELETVETPAEEPASTEEAAPASVDGIMTAGENETVAVTIGGLHSAQISWAKLYTYADGTKGETDLLEGISTEEDGWMLKYSVELAPGDYWLEGYDSENYCNGGIKISVSAEGENKITVYRIYEIYATNSGWVEGTDYEINVTVTSPEGTEREIELGTASCWGNVRTSCLFVSGDTVNATLTPIGERAESATSVTVTKSKVTMNNSISAKIPQVLMVTITAPKGSTVSAGTFGNYYVYTFVEPSVTETEDGVTAVFRMPEAASRDNHFYRVQNPDGVTYWNFVKWTEDTEIEVTAEELYIGSEDFGKETIYRYDKNVYDRADIYLNANGKGYMNLEVGETFEFNVFRNWMAIESYMNAKVALPDMKYEVIDMNGNPSDILTIVPDENNSSVAKMTANKEGTAVVLVTYDAMTHMQGQGGTQFSAIWPECTGVVVVTVGADGSSIETNMLIDRMTAATTAIDAEHDPLFYLGKEGASYSFTPEDGCTVSVNRAIVGDKLTYGGFTTEGVSVDAETGEVTVSGLTSGRHIVKVEKDGLATYQVITAREVSYVLMDSEGNPIDSTDVKPGDTVKLQFSNLVNPAEKLSGAYNFNASLLYKGEDGTTFRTNGGYFGVYDFSGNPARQLITITIPADWGENSYSLNGAILMGGFGNTSVGDHRGVTYAEGLDPNFNASTVGMILGRLPEVVLCFEHELSAVEAKEPNCSENGNIAHWECENCKKLFADENAETELSAEEVTIAKNPDDHSFGEWKTEVAATEEHGGKETRTCSVCGYTETKYIPVKAPNPGVTVVAPREEDETNPNTGAPVFSALTAILYAGVIFGKKRR